MRASVTAAIACCCMTVDVASINCDRMKREINTWLIVIICLFNSTYCYPLNDRVPSVMSCGDLSELL